MQQLPAGMQNFFILIPGPRKSTPASKPQQVFRISHLIHPVTPHLVGLLQLSDMAREASESRIYGAIHYRSDCVKGLEAGNKVGEYAIARARTDGAE